MGRRKKEEDSHPFKPQELVINDLVGASEDKILEKIFEVKEQEWDSLPIIKRHRGRHQRERIDEIIYNHHHHPSSFALNTWIPKGISEIPIMTDDPPLIGFEKRLAAALYESEFYNGLERFKMKQDPIFECSDIREFLNFFIDKFNIPFNFVCTNIGRKDQVAFFANTCAFDIIYFCTILSMKPGPLISALKQNTVADGVILLKYNFDSNSVSKEKDEAQKKQSFDNVQMDEYKIIVNSLEHMEIEIVNMFYVSCPCIKEGKIHPDDARLCINND